jgi:hypothetical protein
MWPAGHVSEAPGQCSKLTSQWLSDGLILNRSAIKFKISLKHIWNLGVKCRMPDDTITERSISLAECCAMVR